MFPPKHYFISAETLYCFGGSNLVSRPKYEQKVGIKLNKVALRIDEVMQKIGEVVQKIGEVAEKIGEIALNSHKGAI